MGSRDNNWFRLVAYSLGHFFVDFSCALLMLSRLRGLQEWWICVLFYNFCAFALQMPIGLLADKLDRNSRIATLGCVLIATGWFLTSIPMLSAVISGVGNSCFHVGGGIDALNQSETKSAPLGIFVSPGAFGIYFGAALGKALTVPSWLPVLGLLLFATVFSGFDLRSRNGRASVNTSIELSLGNGAIMALACCILVVMLRSYVGMVISFPWKTGGWALVYICAVVFGKTVGGFLGDAIGIQKAAVGSLGLSALLFCFSNLPLAGVVAVFLFNMTMPITLWAAVKLLPGIRGFAFGVLTFALFLGFLPMYLNWPTVMQSGVGYAAGALASMVLLMIGLRKGRVQ